MFLLLFSFLRMREEKMEMKKRHHEERLKIAIERATSDSKKQVCISLYLLTRELCIWLD